MPGQHLPPRYTSTVSYIYHNVRGRWGDAYCQPPNRNPTNKAHRRPKGNGFKDIRAKPDTTIYRNWDFPSGDRGTFAQCIQCSGLAVELATSVIGNHHAVYAVPDSELDIVGRADYAH